MSYSYRERVLGEDAPYLPIVVGLHFHGSSARITDLILFSGFAGPCRLIFPHGAFPVGDGYSWYDGVFYDLADSAKCKVITAVAADLASLLEDLARHHPEAPKPIVVGASQGGDLAAALAVLYPDTVGLAIPVAANLPPELAQRTGVGSTRIRFFHGVDDAVVPITVARKSVELIAKAAHDVALTEYAGIGHAVPDEMRIAIHEEIKIVVKGGAES